LTSAVQRSFGSLIDLNYFTLFFRLQGMRCLG